MFGNHAAVEVYEDLGLGAGHLAPVLECKQLATERTSAYHVVILKISSDLVKSFHPKRALTD